MDLKQKLRGMLSMSKDGDEEPPEVLWQVKQNYNIEALAGPL